MSVSEMSYLNSYLSDLKAFVGLSSFKTGVLDYVPMTILDSHLTLTAFLGRIAAIPKIAAFIAANTPAKP